MSIHDTAKCAPPITEFLDYVDWLSELFRHHKTKEPKYTFRKLSADLGLGSNNAHLVIHGKRSLTRITADKIADSLQLTAVHRKYLHALVKHKRAKSAADREAAFQTIIDIKSRITPSQLDKDRLSFFNHWYNAAILELLSLPKAKTDPEWIASAFLSRISKTEIKNALSLLTGLGLLEDLDGKLMPTQKTISTGNEVAGLAVVSFHQQMIEQAKKALGDVHGDDREISSLTLAVSRNTRLRIKQEIVAFRKQMLQLADESELTKDEDGGHEVIQLNFQLFPLATTGDQE